MFVCVCTRSFTLTTHRTTPQVWQNPRDIDTLFVIPSSTNITFNSVNQITIFISIWRLFYLTYSDTSSDMPMSASAFLLTFGLFFLRVKAACRASLILFSWTVLKCSNHILLHQWVTVLFLTVLQHS